MKSYKPVWIENGEVKTSVVSYTEDLANDRADELEDKGLEVLDVVECKPGTPYEVVVGWFK